MYIYIYIYIHMYVYIYIYIYIIIYIAGERGPRVRAGRGLDLAVRAGPPSIG